MGREIKRVPMDFDYPMGEVWYGYLFSFCNEDSKNGCERCKWFAKIMCIPYKKYENIQYESQCPDWESYFNFGPPVGDGYQLWETTSEGSPISPVFDTAEKLAEWCEENATVFADIKATKEKWMEMIKEDMIVADQNGVLFV